MIKTEQEWTEAAKHRFGVLSRKFALGQLNPKEANEYENLKIQRRRANPSRSRKRIQADNELHLEVQTVVADLQRLIDQSKGCPHAGKPQLVPLKQFLGGT
ncbi:MAG: hypothetical protein NTV46_10505 [Verrucomicrobia bacterium]|nr:hypothetical protein [Verrucomicrobiota bacterium]